MRQKFFIDWKEAHTAAVEYARECKHDVALSKSKDLWSGKRGFSIKLASRNDSDYYLAEIVRPGDPV